MTGPTARPSAAVRALWLAGGWVSLATGLVGIVVPLLPTTPFILLSAFCFQRGSDRLHRWITQHPRFGPLIADWRERGAIPRRAKRNAMIALSAVLAISWFAGVSQFVLIVQAAVMSVVAVFILTRPE